MTALAIALLLAQTSPNMGMTIPTPGVTPGPTYATNISNDLSIIDAHNHTPGNGALVPTAGLNINANLPFNGFGATGFNSCTGTACTSLPDAGQFVLLDGGGLVNGAITANSYGYFSNADSRTNLAGPVYSIAQVGDFDSLVPSYLGDRAFQNICSSNTVNYQIGTGSPQSGSLFDWGIDENPTGISAQILIQAARFSLPLGSTGATVTAYMEKGAVDTGTTALGFTNGACNTNLNTQGFTLTSSMAPYSFSKTGLSQFTDYYAGWFGNGSGFGASATSDPIMGPIQVKPTGSFVGPDAGVFSGDFWRIGAGAKTLWGNVRDIYKQDGTYWPSPASYFVVETDATQMEIEVENTTTTSPAISGAIYVNGLPFEYFQPTQNGQPEFIQVSLPSGDKELQVFGSSQTQTGTTFDSRDGTLLDALYFPAMANTKIRMPPPLRSLVFYGDSVCQGTSFPVPVQGGYVAILRTWFNGTVTQDCEGSRSLGEDLNDGSGGVSQANLAALVNNLTAARPTDIWLEMGINDYQGSGGTNQWTTTAQFAAAYSALMDSLHQRAPEANIYMQTMTLTSVEATSVNGFTPPNYRTQETNICNARPWCILVDGTTLLSSSEVNGVHPLAGSHSKLARGIIAKLNATGAAISPIAWSSQFPAGIQVDGGAVVNGLVSVSGPISESLATTSLTLEGNAPVTAGIGVTIDNQTTQTSGSIVAFETGGTSKATINNAGSFLSNPGLFTSGVTTTTVTLKGTATAGNTATAMDGTVDVTGTGYITKFNAAATGEFAITGRGHLIPLSAAPTAGTLNGGLGTVTGLSITGSDASCRINFTTGTATAIAAGGVIMIVTLNQAYSAAATANAIAAFANAPGAAVSEVPLTAVFGAANQVSLYSTTGAWTPSTGTAYSISLTTMGAGATN